ncbi:MAG: helix-hairpin-helix domain-containing protein [Turicibacter sp.]
MKKQLLIMCACVVMVIGIIILSVQSMTPRYKYTIPSENEVEETHVNQEVEDVNTTVAVPVEIKSKIVVDVKGEVTVPAVYEVDEGMRVNDVIMIAGGLTVNANSLEINLSQKIYDEMVIYVPHLDEERSVLINQWDNTSQSVGHTQNDSSSGNVSLNSASKDQLMTLPGIGAVKAEAIINYRETTGTFNQIEELLNVSGIGEKTLDSIRDLIGI